MTTTIILKDLCLYAYHGALSQERMVGSAYRLTLEVGTDFSAAMRNDRLAGTVNYAAIYEVIKKEMQTPSQLVEHAAARVCKALFTAFPAIDSLRLTMLKENPPVPGQESAGMGVSISVTRDEMESNF